MGACLATMLFECCVRQVTSIGDANKMAHQGQGQHLNFSFCMGFPFWLDRIELPMDTPRKNAPGHASRDANARPSTLCVWSFWRNSLVRRLMWKRTSDRRLWTLVIAVHSGFTSLGISVCKEGSTDNFRDSSVFEKFENISLIEETNESLLHRWNVSKRNQIRMWWVHIICFTCPITLFFSLILRSMAFLSFSFSFLSFLSYSLKISMLIIVVSLPLIPTLGLPCCLIFIGPIAFIPMHPHFLAIHHESKTSHLQQDDFFLFLFLCLVVRKSSCWSSFSFSFSTLSFSCPGPSSLKSSLKPGVVIVIPDPKHVF